MRNINPLNSTIKNSMAALIAAGTVVLFQAPAHATAIVEYDYIIVNDTEDHRQYYDSHNDSYFSYYDMNRSQDTQVQGTFLETTSSGSNTQISAYNDGDGVADTPGDNTYTTVGEPLTLAQAGAITYHNTAYVAFYLEANQKGTDDGTLGNNYYDVDKLEIYTSAFSQVDSYKDDDGGTNDVVDGNQVYSFDKEEHNGGYSLRLFYGSGNSNWDIALYVPYQAFIDASSDISDNPEEIYIHFYVEYHDTAGADYWGYDRGADIIPEPSSALLVSLGGIIGLLRRRR